MVLVWRLYSPRPSFAIYVFTSIPIMASTLDFARPRNIDQAHLKISKYRFINMSEPSGQAGQIPEHPEISCNDSMREEGPLCMKTSPGSVITCISRQTTAVIVVTPWLWKFSWLISKQAWNCHNCGNLVIAGKRCGSCKTQNRRPTRYAHLTLSRLGTKTD